MKSILTLIAFIFASIAAMAADLTIVPKFQPGQTIRYSTYSRVLMRHEADSALIECTMSPKVVVESVSGNGAVLSGSNRMDSLSVVGTMPDISLLGNESQFVNIMASTDLQIKLGNNFQPESILNIDAFRRKFAFMIARSLAGITDDDFNYDDIDWDFEPDPILMMAVDEVCKPRHIIDELFGYTSYFSFYGIPLKSGKIPTQKVLSEKLLYLCDDIKNLDIVVSKFEGDGVGIRVAGKSKNSTIEGQWMFADGIVVFGCINIDCKNWDADYNCTYIIDLEKNNDNLKNCSESYLPQGEAKNGLSLMRNLQQAII